MKPLQLAPIHLPPTPSWWPPAPGWWLLALLACVAIIGLLFLGRRWRRRRQLQGWLSQQSDALATDPQWHYRLHRLLRRALCQLDPQLQQASEAHWQASLTAVAGKLAIPHLLEMEQQRYANQAPASPQQVLAEAMPLLRQALLHQKRSRKRLASRRNHHG